jgi:hypothetical protein
MYNFLSGIFLGFLTGFVSGYTINFFSNVYKNYKLNNNKSKAMAQEIFTIYSKSIFDTLYDELESNNIELPELGQIFNVSHDISELLKDYNKKYKIIIKKGVPVLQMIDNSYLKNEKVISVLEFFNKNDIDITINKNEKPLKLK